MKEKNTVYEKVFSDIVDTPIVKNELGDSAGVFGAKKKHKKNQTKE